MKCAETLFSKEPELNPTPTQCQISLTNFLK